MDRPIIEVKDLRKKYDKKLIFEHADLTIHPGESIAFVGHNGCGKSTFLRIVSGLTRYDRGSISYNKNLKFNYIPEHFPKLDITPEQYVKHICTIEKSSEQKARQLFGDFFMEEHMQTPLKHLSKGTLQKVGVVQALITVPDILLMDEPLSGQDAASQKVFIKKIREMREQNVTLLMSCHERFLINQISSRVYEVENKAFREVRLDDDWFREREILLFQREDREVRDEVKAMAEDVSYTEQFLKIETEETNSSDVIRYMLEDGYRLWGIHHE